MAYAGTLKFDTKLFGDGFTQGVKKLEAAAKGALKAVGGSIAATAVAVVAFGSQMEHGMAKVSTMLTGTAQECGAALERIEGSLLKTSGATGEASSALAEAAYQALSAGVAVEKTGSFVDKAAKLAVGGFTSTEKAVDVMSSVVNAYGEEVMSAEKASTILMQTQNKGKTTIDQLAHSIAQVTPTAAAMKVGFDQVGASLATMTAQGVPTAQATTQLNQLFAELGKSGTVAATALGEATAGTQYAGKSFSMLMDEGVPLSDLLMLMSDRAEANGLEMLDMFGSIESGKAALSIINKNGKTFTDNLSAMGTTADVVGTAYSKMMDTFAKKKDVFVETTKNVAIAAYKHLEVPLKKAADVGIEWMNKLMKIVQKDGDKIISTLKTVTGVAASLVAGFMAFKATSSIASAFLGIAKAVQAAGGAMAMLNAAFAVSSWGWIALGVGAVVTAVGLLTTAYMANEPAAQRDLELAIERNKVLGEQAEAYEELKRTQFEQAAADLTQIEHSDLLARRLQGLTDETGFVSEANQGLAGYIISQLNDALGTEIKMIDGQIQGHQTLQGELKKTMDLKRAEVLLAAQEEIWAQAIKDRTVAQTEQATSYIKIGKAEDEVTQWKIDNAAKLNAIEEERVMVAANLLQETSLANQYRREGLFNELAALEGVVAKEKETYNSLTNTIRDCNSNIVAHEDARVMAQVGNTEGVVQLLTMQGAGYLTLSDLVGKSAAEQQQILGEQYANQLIQLDIYASSLKAGHEGYNQEGLAQQREYAIKAGIEAQSAGAAIVNGEIMGLEGKRVALNSTIQSLSDNGIQIVNGSIQQWETSGTNTTGALIAGVDSKKGELEQAAQGLSDSGVAILNDNAAQWNTSGSNSGTEHADGISSTEEEVTASAKGISMAATTTLSGSLNKFYSLGVDGGSSYVNGLLSQVNAANAAGAALAAAGAPKSKNNTSPAKSPSRVQSRAQGYVAGAESQAPMVANTPVGMADTAAPAGMVAAATPAPASVNFAALAAEYAPKFRAAAMSFQQRAADSATAHMTRTSFAQQAVPTAQGIAEAIAGALSKGFKSTVAVPVSVQVGGRELFKAMKEVEVTFGCDVGGGRYAW